MQLEFTRLQRGQIQVDKRDELTGALIARYIGTFKKNSDYADAPTMLGCDKFALMNAVDKFDRDGTPSQAIKLEEPEAEKFVIRVRGLKQNAATAKEYSAESALTALEEAIAAKEHTEAQEPFIFWKDASKLCTIDLDVDESVEAWTELRLRAFIASFNPVPALAWTTHGGGLRLVYHHTDNFSAEEIAAIAFLYLCETQRFKSLEFKTETRHPGYVRANSRCSSVLKQNQNFDAGVLRKWLRQYNSSDDAVVEWLEERKLKMDQRYDHTYCPIEPSESGRGNPVLVGIDGIFCFVCEAHGVLRGSKRAGFFPYSYLVGGHSATQLHSCLEHFTHWEQIKFILESQFSLTGRYAKLVYSAALKLQHSPTDVRIPMVFKAGSDLIRLDRKWANGNGETYVRDIGPILESLPVATMLTANGTAQDRVMLAKLTQPMDLTHYGYPPLTPIIGCRIYSHHLPPTRSHEYPIIFQTSDLSSEAASKFRPRYIAKSARGNVEDAWNRIEVVCPGVNRQLITALIAAKGVAEGAMSMPPMIFITGPTGAAKSSSVTLAAAICGDKNTEIVWTANTDRIRQNISDMKERSTFMTFNEILKESEISHVSPTTAMDFLLNLTPESVSWKIFTGPIQLGTLPVFIWTDTEIPLSVKQDAQIARRLIHAQLTSGVDWKTSLKHSGVGQVRYLRRHSIEYAEACNIILSDIIDRFFQERMTFEEIARELGFYSLIESEESVEKDEILSRFFRLVCEAPKLSGSDAIRWKGGGWKKITRAGDTDIELVWNQICDEAANEGKFVTSRRCSETDWQKLIHASEPVRFEIRSNGQSCIAVRFINASHNRKEYRCNEELVNGKVELESRKESLRDDRFRDAKRTEPERSWFAEVSEKFRNASNESRSAAS